MGSLPQQEGIFGQEQIASQNNEFNALSFMINQILGRVNVATLVRVDAVNTTGRTSPVGTVDVTPLVNQRAGDGSLVPHTSIHGVPFMRYQGGANAVICDPKVGDVGMCAFADRDISTVQKTSAQGPPGSLRRFDYADALYLGGWLNTITPERFIVIDDSGISIEGGPTIQLHANEVVINSDTNVVVNASAEISLNAPLVVANGVTIS